METGELSQERSVGPDQAGLMGPTQELRLDSEDNREPMKNFKPGRDMVPYAFYFGDICVLARSPEW